MKRIALFILSVTLLLTGCATNLSVSYLRPSDVDMGGYRNIAIASAVPYRGYLSYPSRTRSLDSYTASIVVQSSYGRSLPKYVADYATNYIVSTLDKTGYYSILTPNKTDKVLALRDLGMNASSELLKLGYDAVMIPRIEDMSIDERIWAVVDGYEEGKNGEKLPKLEFYIKRIASLDMSITVIDCKTDKIVAKEYYSGHTEYEDEFDPVFPIFTEDANYLFRSIIGRFSRSILNDFVPSRVTATLPLMSNKPKLEDLGEAYDAAKNGSLDYAYKLFYLKWQENGHIPSGYNAALIKGALGQYDEALEILSDMKGKVYDKSVNTLYNDILAMRDSTEKAQKQIDSVSSDIQSSQKSYTVYDYVLGY